MKKSAAIITALSIMLAITSCKSEENTDLIIPESIPEVTTVTTTEVTTTAVVTTVVTTINEPDILECEYRTADKIYYEEVAQNAVGFYDDTIYMAERSYKNVLAVQKMTYDRLISNLNSSCEIFEEVKTIYGTAYICGKTSDGNYCIERVKDNLETEVVYTSAEQILGYTFDEDDNLYVRLVSDGKYVLRKYDSEGNPYIQGVTYEKSANMRDLAFSNDRQLYSLGIADDNPVVAVTTAVTTTAATTTEVTETTEEESGEEDTENTEVTKEEDVSGKKSLAITVYDSDMKIISHIPLNTDIIFNGMINVNYEKNLYLYSYNRGTKTVNIYSADKSTGEVALYDTVENVTGVYGRGNGYDLIYSSEKSVYGYSLNDQDISLVYDGVQNGIYCIFNTSDDVCVLFTDTECTEKFSSIYLYNGYMEHYDPILCKKSGRKSVSPSGMILMEQNNSLDESHMYMIDAGEYEYYDFDFWLLGNHKIDGMLATKDFQIVTNQYKESAGTSSIAVYDIDGEKIASEAIKERVYGMAVSADDRVFLQTSDGKKYYFQEFDMKKGKISERKIEAYGDVLEIYNGSGGYDFLYRTTDGVIGVNFTVDKHTKVFDFVNSDFPEEDIMKNFYISGDGTMYAVSQNGVYTIY